MKNLFNVVLLVCISLTSAFTQNDITKFFPAGQQNASTLIDAYLRPGAQDLSVLLNAGWYTTAKTHKKFGFDISATVNNILISSDKKYFARPANLQGLQYLGSSGGNLNELPTIYGPENEVPNFVITSGANSGEAFQGPEGTDPGSDYVLQAQAIPTLQVGFGLFKNTDIRIRFTPVLKIRDTEISNWGIAFQHDIKQHIPGLRELPFSWSVFAGYTNLSAELDLSGEIPGSGQKGDISGRGITIQTLASKTFSVVTFYASLGYQTSSLDYDIKGVYRVGEPGGQSNIILNAPFTLTDPFSFNYNTNSVRGTAGIQFKFGPVKLNSDYTLAKAARVFTAGLGLTFN